MIIIKNKASIEKMRTAGKLLAGVMASVRPLIRPGVTTLQINDAVEQSMLEAGLKPECKGYAGYRHATCISVNDVIVHGVPSDEVVLQDGDLVKVDVVGSYRGYCADMARSFFVGSVDPETERLQQVAQRALDAALDEAMCGLPLSDISSRIQRTVENEGFSVVRQFVGHGIGKSMHEAPEVPNFGSPGRGPVLREGMTLAIEPMIAQNGPEVRIMPDGWTARTADGGLAAHVEDTILISKDGPEVLTRL